MQYDRTDRIAEELKHELMDLIRNTLKDPALGEQIISIVKAEVTRDLYHAKIFISVYGDAERRKTVIAALKRAEPFLKRELGQRMGIRRIPQLHFHADDSMEYAMHISKLIDEIGVELTTDRDRENSDAQ